MSTTTCELNGLIFQRGESLGGSFVTRCGPADVYPCFCNPDLSQQVECPYCGFALEGGGLLCAKDLEIHTFADIDGNSKTCECSAPLGGASPTFDCEIEDDQSLNQPGVEDGGSCTFDMPDGSTISFLSGEPILSAVFFNRCGDDFPCYCDQTSDDQVSCPYCRFPAMGGEMFCARNGQVVALQDEDGVNQMCTCTIAQDDGVVSSNCITSDGDAVPTTTPVDQSKPIDQSDVCTLELGDGTQVMTFQNGESFGEYLSTRCGSASDFPCFCNTALPNKVDCPYCGFVKGDGELVCARSDETIGFVDGDKNYRTCTCEIVAPGQEPIRTCEDGDMPPTPAPTDPSSFVENPTSNNDGNVCFATGRNGEIVAVQDGESFGDLIPPGICGSTDEWPAFCNVALVGTHTISRQEGNVDTPPALFEYPYCIFENTKSGTPVCAKSTAGGQGVTFVDDSGITQRCSCTYLSPSLGGAQSSCIPEVVVVDDPSTTKTPTPSAAPQKDTSRTMIFLTVSTILCAVELFQ